MLENKYPILEFDEDCDALINPFHIYKSINISQRAVLCFFGDAIDKLKNEYEYEIVYTINSESQKYPVYEFTYKNNKIVIVHVGVGAPIAAGIMEELNALGCDKFIACGGCGVLTGNLPVGNLLIPTIAIRDEGTSYHYLPPSREVIGNTHAIKCIEETLMENNLEYLKVKTWTTDAFFRETRAKIKKRKEEGCITVEMEASAFMAVSLFRKVLFGQILYAGDDLSGTKWDKRSWNDRSGIREIVLKMAIEACYKL